MSTQLSPEVAYLSLVDVARANALSMITEEERMAAEMRRQEEVVDAVGSLAAANS